MKTMKSIRTRGVAIVTIALGSAMMLGGCDKPAPTASTATDGVTSENLADKVDQARTPADHQVLAQYYDEQARLAQREVADEREAQTRYAHRWNPDEHPMGRGPREHYGHMIEGREGSASHHRAMAEWHREMATRAEREQVANE